MSNICRECKGKLREGTTSVELWRDSVSVEILNVPARICSDCGEAYIAIDVAERLDELADAVIARRETLEHVVQDAFGTMPPAFVTSDAALSSAPPNRLRGLKVAWQ